MVVVIIGIVAAIAMPSFRGVRERAQVVAAVSEITVIQQTITEFRLLNNRLPIDLGEIGLAADRDPWGRAYVFADHDFIGPGAKRKDRFLVPVNSDYDLYSMGADGASVAPFTAGPSRDDIVRANNGGFVGLAVLF